MTAPVTAPVNAPATARPRRAPATHTRASAPETPLPAGTPAPDFTLHSTPDQTVSLQDFRGRPVVLAFYPADWSPVCGDEMSLFNAVLPEFAHAHAQLLGISVDGVWSHTAFAADRKLHFPLLADFEPKGAVAKRYGVYRPKDGTTQRALFVIDAEGVIRWSYLSPEGVNPGADGVLAALDALAPTPQAATPDASTPAAASPSTSPSTSTPTIGATT